jgi:hypothetical protein
MAIKDDDRTRKERREEARAKRIELERQAASAASRRRRLTWVGGGVALAAVVAAIAIGASGGGGSSGGGSKQSKTLQSPSTPILKLGPLSTLGKLRPVGSLGSIGPEGVPVPSGPALADTSAMATGGTVDGIQCLGSEQLLFHIHAHLAIFVNGAARQVPFGVGIAGAQAQGTPQGPFVSNGGCFYWLHSHAADGIIHIESPQQRTFTLGNYFDIWGQPLSPTQVGPAVGPVTAIYNGQRYLANPRDIPLNAHAQIQLEVGTPLVAPETVSFPNGL